MTVSFFFTLFLVLRVLPVLSKQPRLLQIEMLKLLSRTEPLLSVSLSRNLQEVLPDCSVLCSGASCWLLPGLAVPLLASPISLKEQGHQPAKEEARGDVQAPLDEVGVPRTANGAPNSCRKAQMTLLQSLWRWVR